MITLVRHQQWIARFLLDDVLIFFTNKTIPLIVSGLMAGNVFKIGLDYKEKGKELDWAATPTKTA